MSTFRLGNIKGSFKYSKTEKNTEIIERLKSDDTKTIKQHKNFLVLRATFVYIIFPSSGYVNVTKIRKICEIKPVFHEFIQLTGIIPNSRFKIHNIHAFGSFEIVPNLHKFQRELKDLKIEKTIVSFNPSFFHGLKIRIEELGTFVLFQSGNYSFLGAKSIAKLQKLSKIIGDIIQNNLSCQNIPFVTIAEMSQQ